MDRLEHVFNGKNHDDLRDAVFKAWPRVDRTKPFVDVDCQNQEILIEHNKESIMVKAKDIPHLRALLEAAEIVLSRGDAA